MKRATCQAGGLFQQKLWESAHRFRDTHCLDMGLLPKSVSMYILWVYVCVIVYIYIPTEIAIQ